MPQVKNLVTLMWHIYTTIVWPNAKQFVNPSCSYQYHVDGLIVRQVYFNIQWTNTVRCFVLRWVFLSPASVFPQQGNNFSYFYLFMLNIWVNVKPLNFMVRGCLLFAFHAFTVLPLLFSVKQIWENL